ncbi:MAG: hypothetical protein ACI4GW_13170 [Lachnospiraceae bacterium]
MIKCDITFQDEELIWFIGIHDHTLYSVNKNNEITIRCILPYAGNINLRAYSSCVKYQNKILCLPVRANDICIYDIESDRLDKIYIETANDAVLALQDNWVINDTLWSLSRTTKTLYQIDILNKRVVNNFVIGDDNLTIGLQSGRINQKLYFPISNQNKVVIFDTDIMTIEEHEMNCNEKGFGTITHANGLTLLTGYSNCIYTWDIESDRVERYDFSKLKLFVEEKAKKYPKFQKSIETNNYIVFIPYITEDSISDNILVIEKKTFKFKKILSDICWKKRQAGEQMVVFAKTEDSVVIQDPLRNNYVEISIDDGKEKNVLMTGNEQENHRYWKEKGIPILGTESQVYKLDNFIESLLKK